ncbi:MULTISPECIES: dTMP kinase [unclassified Corynebacterium]|uniref:dTMP kinase n=1 Tax=unclassified Corynebacterium TaxID=2624378 RepID=UPI002A90DECB|nr:dTMP kinase [Corynebacterium sp.]MDY5786316.1 dTMP kinase [Corynebacterium sp.]
MIIAVEGIDGAGKNTLVTAVRDALGAETLAFPRYGASIHADIAHDALHGRMGDLSDSAYGMATIFALDRAGAKELLDAYVDTSERIIILDRFVASNAAYTAARTGDPGAIEWVRELEFGRLGLPVPDLHVLVDTPPEEARRRAKHREGEDASRARDQYERNAQLQADTFAAYEQLAAQSWVSRWVRATEPGTIIQAVHEF